MFLIITDFHQFYNLHKDNANDTEDSGVVLNPFSFVPQFQSKIYKLKDLDTKNLDIKLIHIMKFILNFKLSLIPLTDNARRRISQVY